MFDSYEQLETTMKSIIQSCDHSIEQPQIEQLKTLFDGMDKQSLCQLLNLYYQTVPTTNLLHNEGTVISQLLNVNHHISLQFSTED